MQLELYYMCKSWDVLSITPFYVSFAQPGVIFLLQMNYKTNQNNNRKYMYILHISAFNHLKCTIHSLLCTLILFCTN